MIFCFGSSVVKNQYGGFEMMKERDYRIPLLDAAVEVMHLMNPLTFISDRKTSEHRRMRENDDMLFCIIFHSAYIVRNVGFFVIVTLTHVSGRSLCFDSAFVRSIHCCLSFGFAKVMLLLAQVRLRVFDLLDQLP